MVLVDFHAHAFPDAVAERAVSALTGAAGIQASLDGTVAGLLSAMDQEGVDWSVVASIATKPEQFPRILDWSLQIASPRLVPFASIHPRDPLAVPRITEIAERGLRGVKLHPYYQDFVLDDESLFPLYAKIQELGLVLLVHAGFDIAYPRVRQCDPLRTLRLIQKFPDLRLIAAHLGGWEDWDAVEELLIGKPVYLDTAYSIEVLGAERARRMLLAHPPEFLLFGSDSPWEALSRSIAAVTQLELPPELERRILGENAVALLNRADQR